MIAFGPYIIMATLIVMYFGDDQIIRYYERLSMRWVHMDTFYPDSHYYSLVAHIM